MQCNTREFIFFLDGIGTVAGEEHVWRHDTRQKRHDQSSLADSQYVYQHVNGNISVAAAHVHKHIFKIVPYPEPYSDYSMHVNVVSDCNWP